MSAKSEEKRIRLLAQRCGARLEKTRDTCQYGYAYILWHADGSGSGADDVAAIEAELQRRFPDRIPKRHLDWDAVLLQGKAIVESYDTGVTLRQLFYRLVSRQIIPNEDQRYDYLSWRSAAARRAGWFPDLVDQGSEIIGAGGYESPESAIKSLADYYVRDHTEGQKVSLYLGVEKAGIQAQLLSWFGELGVSILALGGYASQSYIDQIIGDVAGQDRPAVLIYAGDHDASGDDIYRDFVQRTDCWKATHRIALTKEQIEEYDLPENPGKDADTRTEAFMERHGYDTNVQVELDALAPDVLRGLYQAAIDEYWDDNAYQKVIAREAEERDQLWRVKLPPPKRPRPTSRQD